jgi:hypothetical protein
MNMSDVVAGTIEALSAATETMAKACEYITELQAKVERLDRMLYEERREHRNDQDVASETIERLHDQIAALS